MRKHFHNALFRLKSSQVERGIMSLYELIHEFLFDCKVRELSDQTIINYDRQLHKFRSFVKENFQVIQFEDLKPIHVKQYVSSLQDRGCKPAYTNDLLKAVKCLCSYAQREEKTV